MFYTLRFMVQVVTIQGTYAILLYRRASDMASGGTRIGCLVSHTPTPPCPPLPPHPTRLPHTWAMGPTHTAHLVLSVIITLALTVWLFWCYGPTRYTPHRTLPTPPAHTTRTPTHTFPLPPTLQTHIVLVVVGWTPTPHYLTIVYSSLSSCLVGVLHTELDYNLAVLPPLPLPSRWPQCNVTIPAIAVYCHTHTLHTPRTHPVTPHTFTPPLHYLHYARLPHALQRITTYRLRYRYAHTHLCTLRRVTPAPHHTATRTHLRRTAHATAFAHAPIHRISRFVG